jgi:hypothetical protein
MAQKSHTNTATIEAGATAEQVADKVRQNGETRFAPHEACTCCTGLWVAVGQRSDQLQVQVIPSMQGLPSRLGDRLYVVGQPGKFKWAILACPCGCGERIDVCLMPSARPRWELTLRDGRASLSPSIWVPAERCGSHFWLRRNKIVWSKS